MFFGFCRFRVVVAIGKSCVFLLKQSPHGGFVGDFLFFFG